MILKQLMSAESPTLRHRWLSVAYAVVLVSWLVETAIDLRAGISVFQDGHPWRMAVNLLVPTCIVVAVGCLWWETSRSGKKDPCA